MITFFGGVAELIFLDGWDAFYDRSQSTPLFLFSLLGLDGPEPFVILGYCLLMSSFNREVPALVFGSLSLSFPTDPFFCDRREFLFL